MKECRICGKIIKKRSGCIKYKMFYSRNKMNLFSQNLYYCNDCDFIFSNILSHEYLDYLYEKGDDYTNYSNTVELEKENYIHRVNSFENLIQLLNIDFDSLLDVGSCTGLLLSKFKNKTIQGIETSRAGVFTAKERYDIDVFEGTFQEFCGQENSCVYDMITMCHVMEHIENLSEWMNCVLKKSKHYVYVEVPCFSTRIKNEPLGFFAQEHINYWTPFSLVKIFDMYGFTPIYLDIDYMMGYKIANGFPMIRVLFEKKRWGG